MSRHVIGYEGKPSAIDGVWLAKESLYVQPDQRYIPVTRGFSWEGAPLGVASDIQRDEDSGAVSVEIEFKEGYERSEDEMKLYSFTFMATHLVVEDVPATDEQPAYKLYTEARLRQIALVPNAAIPREFTTWKTKSSHQDRKIYTAHNEIHQPPH